MALTFAQLVAPAAQDDRDASGVPGPLFSAYRLAKKRSLYADLAGVGVSGVYSWTTGSVPSSLVEIYAWALSDYDVAQAYVAQGSLNSLATGQALDSYAGDVYQNVRALGTYTVAQVLLTDVTGAGPFTFQPSTVSFSVGRGGLLFNGLDLLGTGQPVTLPKSGTCRVYVKSAGIGSAYSTLALNAVNYFARGALVGASVANDANWLNFPQAVTGADAEPDGTLQLRDSSKWGTLGTGSPQLAYLNWALTAQPTQVTRCSVLTNLEILDPGRVDVVVAGSVGAVGAGVVQAVQDYIAPLQVGGARIPETARCVVSSATNHVVSVSGTVYVQKELLTDSFKAQVAADFGAYASGVPVGGGPLGLVSADRLLEVLQYRAGLLPGVFYDVRGFTPAADVQIAYNEVPVVSLSSVTWVPV